MQDQSVTDRWHAVLNGRTSCSGTAQRRERTLFQVYPRPWEHVIEEYLCKWGWGSPGFLGISEVCSIGIGVEHHRRAMHGGGKERRITAGPQLSMSLTVCWWWGGGGEGNHRKEGGRVAVWQHETGIPVELPDTLWLHDQHKHWFLQLSQAGFCSNALLSPRGEAVSAEQNSVSCAGIHKCLDTALTVPLPACMSSLCTHRWVISTLLAAFCHPCLDLSPSCQCWRIFWDTACLRQELS